jgi:transposase
MSIKSRRSPADDVRLRTADRSQMAMKLECLDLEIPADHPVRTVWALIQALDVSAFLVPIKARTGVAGRDATDPRVLIGLWLWACTDGVGSARELDRLCREHLVYRWLAGGLSMNYHTLADFRVEHGQALDDLLTQLIAMLVHKGLVKVFRISQDGLRVRACAGASSFRRGERLHKLLEEAQKHVDELKRQLEDPSLAGQLSARKKAAMERAARQRQQRIQAAIRQLPRLQEKQQKLAKKVAKKDRAKKLKEPRASTTDAEIAVMKMPNGGFNPAVNVQLATDPSSRAILGVEVSNSGVDTGQAQPMRQQVQQRTGQKVGEHLIDGGYLVLDEIEQAAAQGVTLYVPPKPPRNPELRASQYEPRPTDSAVIADWRVRMGSVQGKEIYKQRASTSETANADLRTCRGLNRLLVRGLPKAKCVALWCALAYNVMHFAAALVG